MMPAACVSSTEDLAVASRVRVSTGPGRHQPSTGRSPQANGESTTISAASTLQNASGLIEVHVSKWHVKR